MTRIDRRALFTSSAAATLLAAAGISANAAPRQGGTLRIAVPRDGSLARLARGAAFDQLVEIAPDNSLRGELALAWDGSTNACKWHFELVQNAQFHDGTNVHAEEVANSLKNARVPGLRDVQAIGFHEIRIELAEGNPDFPLVLADQSFAISKAGAPDIGTGVYRIDRLTPDRHFLARKVKHHYKAGRAGWADQIKVTVIPDAAVRAEALRDGFVDIAALPDAHGLRNRGEFTYLPSAEHVDIAAASGVGIPAVVSKRNRLDDYRIGERWWIA